MAHNREILSTHPMALLSQGEDSILDYTLNWVGRLNGDTVATSSWESETSGATLSGESNTDVKATVRFTADTGTYLLTNTITLTTSGETMQGQFKIKVKDNDQEWNKDYQ